MAGACARSRSATAAAAAGAPLAGARARARSRCSRRRRICTVMLPRARRAPLHLAVDPVPDPVPRACAAPRPPAAGPARASFVLLPERGRSVAYAAGGPNAGPPAACGRRPSPAQQLNRAGRARGLVARHNRAYCARGKLGVSQRSASRLLWRGPAWRAAPPRPPIHPRLNQFKPRPAHPGRQFTLIQSGRGTPAAVRARRLAPRGGSRTAVKCKCRPGPSGSRGNRGATGASACSESASVSTAVGGCRARTGSRRQRSWVRAWACKRCARVWTPTRDAHVAYAACTSPASGSAARCRRGPRARASVRAGPRSARFVLCVRRRGCIGACDLRGDDARSGAARQARNASVSVWRGKQKSDAGAGSRAGRGARLGQAATKAARGVPGLRRGNPWRPLEAPPRLCQPGGRGFQGLSARGGAPLSLLAPARAAAGGRGAGGRVKMPVRHEYRVERGTTCYAGAICVCRPTHAQWIRGVCIRIDHAV